jgi:2Fe-2S ferredoxin
MKYRITFQPADESTELTAGQNGGSRDGLPESILQTANDLGVSIDHACGGVGACSTCHVIVTSGFNSLNEARENEEDMLDSAPGLTVQSRLACQAVPSGESDVVVEIPGWNRNLMSESHE